MHQINQNKLDIMKRFLLVAMCATLLCNTSIYAAKKNVNGTARIPELSPQEVGKTFDFSPEAAKAFAEDPDNETFSDIYDIIGGGCSFYCGCAIGTIKASSHLKAQGKRNYKPANIHDLNYETAWVEGVAGNGVGQWIEYTLPAENPTITDICVVNGYVRTRKAWEENSRPAVLEMFVNGKPKAMLYLKDVYAEQWFDVGEIKPKNGRPLKIKFVIRDVYP